MKLQLGTLACLLAGCATQPTARIGSSGVAADGTAAEAIASRLGAMPGAHVLRIGIEFLPPENPAAAPELAALPTRHAPPPEPSPTRLVERVQTAATRHGWSLSIADLDAVDDPIARETLRFCDDVLREDRRRTEREVRLPFLEWQPPELDLGTRLWSETRIAEAREEWVDENMGKLLGKPFRLMLRRMPIVREFEISLDDFRSSFVPATEPYLLAHDDSDFGRVSLRVRAADIRDPVEIAYMTHGVRLVSSQERAKIGYEVPLGERISLELRASREYRTDHDTMRLDLTYRYSPTTSFHVAAGDDMDFLSTSSIYSVFENAMDGSPGLLVYAVHVF
ncbi:MAG: hypothetical protein U1E73_07200 [Planctomycetota bacterium]